MTVSARRGLALAGLALATLLVFSGVRRNGFVSYDDPAYVTANPHVLGGLTAEDVAWAFKGTAGANWHPVTWLSHMLDVELFGLDAGAHHLVSAALHAASAALLFLFLARATGRDGLALAAAALFALHPLRVESVAWAAERKDVLAGLFWMLALVVHERHARTPRRSTYLALGTCVLLGLLSKPTVVTLPVALLLVDAWPLGRVRARGWRPLVLEKVPWLALSAAAALVTLLAQRAAEAVRSVEQVPLAARLANAALSAWTYLLQTLWPFGLSFHYPHPWLLPGEGGGRLLAAGALAAALLVAFTLFLRRRSAGRPWLSFGWAWYGVTLLPVIGIVQVGIQAHADRYTYLATIGPVVALVWWGGELAGRSEAWRRGLTALAVLALALLAARTVTQVATWRDSETLYRHALALEPRDPTARVNLGALLLERGDVEGAVRELRAALEVRPDHVLAARDLGVALARAGRLDEAARVLARATEAAPGDLETRAALGNVLARAGRLDEAQAELERVLAADPTHVQALFDLGALEAARGELDRAAELFERVLATAPDHAAAREALERIRARRPPGAEPAGR